MNGDTSAGTKRSRGFRGSTSIYCDETGHNIVDLLEDIDKEKIMRPIVNPFKFERSASYSGPIPESSPIRCDGVAINDNSDRKTKIICAIGPASRSVEMLLQLLEAGMNVARLNFSHGDHAYHLESLQNLRTAIELRRSWGYECNCAVLLDTKGPEIRTGLLEDHKPIELHMHQRLEITSDYNYVGNSKRISCSYEHLATSMKPGDTILVADGEIMMKVTETHPEENYVVVKVENNAILQERKNMNLPGVHVRLPGITEKDVYDLKNFALVHKVDIVSGSFIRSAANVKALRECLGEEGKGIRVHAKIESVEALMNIDEIIAAADGIHVSRGDLGMELPISKIFLAQKLIILKANLAGKPVVTSTQMLDSMCHRVRPTNAECSDVGNAVLDGTDCVMLSAETAAGKYPRESVETMSRIIREAERSLNYEDISRVISSKVLSRGSVDVIEALADASVETAYESEAAVMAVVSETGRLPLLIAKYRPQARILVATANPRTARQMSVSRGVYASLVTRELVESDLDLWMHVARVAKRNGWIQSSGKVIMVHTALYGGFLNSSKIQENDPRLKNVIKVLFVPEKIEDIELLYPSLVTENRRNSAEY